MNLAIVKYNAGNIYSVDYALKRLGVEAVITSDKEVLMKADKVIFPGVGEAETTMNFLREQKLDILIKDLKQPVLGICLGMQLMCRHSEEGDADCLGIFDIDVKKFQPTRHEDKVPHMGWNEIHNLDTPLLSGIREGEFLYFVHSYAPQMCDEAIATSENGVQFAAALNKGNFYGTQFHPEKSGVIGEQIIKNFVEKC